MDTQLIISTEPTDTGSPLTISISGGRLELLGFSHGRKVAIEEAYGRITISLLDILEPQPVAVPVFEDCQPPVVETLEEVEKDISSEVHTDSSVGSFEEECQHGLSLFQTLVALRKEISLEAKLPAYIIFHDSTLKQMCEKLPSDMEALKDIQGVGKTKLERYGARFLEAIQEYRKAGEEVV